MGAATAEWLSPSQHGLLRRYLAELERWNRRINLTAVPAGERWSQLVSPALDLVSAAHVDTGARVIDVGSGAGIPGLVLAVVRPDLRVTLLEADTRKSGFLVHTAGLLGLAAVDVVTRRAEGAAHDPALREQFDLVVSRAAAQPAVLCELALPFVRSGGRLMAIVADARAAAAACRAAAGQCGGGDPLAAAQEILVVPKLAAAPARYPRRPGVPARHPLT